MPVTPSNQIFPMPPLTMDVRAWRVWGQLVRTWAQQFVQDFDPPSAIPSASATANNLAVILTWEPAKKAAAYRIHRGTTGDFSAASVVAEPSASKTGVAQYTWQDSEDQTTPTRFYWITPLNERGEEGPKTGQLEVDNFYAANQATAVGINAAATGVDSVAIGSSSLASGEVSTAIGNQSVAQAIAATAVGYQANADDDQATAVGYGAEASGASSVAVGDNASATDTHGVAVGSDSFANLRATAVGYSAQCSTDSLALGAGATTSGSNVSIALGADAVASLSHQLSIGGFTKFIQEARLRLGYSSTFGGVIFSWAQCREEILTIAAAASTDTAIQIPATAVAYGVTVRTLTTIPTAATYTVTGASSGTTFNTAAVSSAAGSTDSGTAAGAFYNATAQAIRITPNAVPAAATGQVRVTIVYYAITPATS